MSRSKAMHIRMSKKVKAMSADQMDKKPGVYEFVNVITGRRYVGASIEPFSRIGIYAYYLKNYASYFPASPFFGSAQLKADIEEHGLGTAEAPVFEFNILEFTNDGDIEMAKFKYYKKYKGKLYNRNIDLLGFKRSVFYELDDDMHKLEDERHTAYHNFNNLTKAHSQLSAEIAKDNKIAVIHRAQRKISTIEFKARGQANSEKKRQSAIVVKQSRVALDELIEKIDQLHGLLVEKYSDVQDVS